MDSCQEFEYPVKRCLLEKKEIKVIKYTYTCTDIMHMLIIHVHTVTHEHQTTLYILKPKSNDFKSIALISRATIKWDQSEVLLHVQGI